MSTDDVSGDFINPPSADDLAGDGNADMNTAHFRPVSSDTNHTKPGTQTLLLHNGTEDAFGIVANITIPHGNTPAIVIYQGEYYIRSRHGVFYRTESVSILDTASRSMGTLPDASEIQGDAFASLAGSPPRQEPGTAPESDGVSKTPEVITVGHSDAPDVVTNFFGVMIGATQLQGDAFQKIGPRTPEDDNK